jgi:hypothetical protein
MMTLPQEDLTYLGECMGVFGGTSKDIMECTTIADRVVFTRIVLPPVHEPSTP